MSSSPPSNLLGIEDLKRHQRESMDPNFDYKFAGSECIIESYSTPCPNGGSDITYMLRYIVNKYNWLDFTDDMVTVVEGVLKLKIKMFELVEANSFLPAKCDKTRVSIEIGTDLNANMEFARGQKVGVEQGYLKVQAVCDGDYFIVESSSLLVEEPGVTFVFMVETLNAEGQTAVDRQFGFRKSALYGADHSPIVTTRLYRNKICPGGKKILRFLCWYFLQQGRSVQI